MEGQKYQEGICELANNSGESGKVSQEIQTLVMGLLMVL